MVKIPVLLSEPHITNVTLLNTVTDDEHTGFK